MTASIVVQRPAGAAAELVLLYHGVGSSADDLEPLGRLVAAARPQAMVVSVNAPQASDLGSGWQWFSVIGVTEDGRPARVAQAMPAFLSSIERWQQASGVGPAQTTLIGFSQGSIMSLESTQGAAAAPAARVLAMAGRFAQPVRQAPAGVRFHLLHGEQDGVIPAAKGREAHAQLKALGADVSADFFPGLGHGIDPRVAQRMLALLSERASG